MMQDAARHADDTMESERRWVQGAKAGDQLAFRRLVERYQACVYTLCYRMLGNQTEAEDAAQETFLRAYSRLHTYDEARKFSSWLLSIGAHYCIDCLRRRRLTYVDIDPLVGSLPGDSDQHQPEKALLRAESDNYVRRVLKGISPDHRTIVVLRYWHQFSYAEIAGILGITESAVKSRLHRARKAMAEALMERQEYVAQVRPASTA